MYIDDTVYFYNPGEINITAITTLGVNVKENDSPIGYFGTGFKFAVATALREGCAVELRSGNRRFEFYSEREVIRGKEFDIVCLREFDPMDEVAPQERSLGFTTHLGKNWKLWQAYREFYSNALDELGGVSEQLVIADTVLSVRSPAFFNVHINRDEFLLDKSRATLIGVIYNAFHAPSIEVYEKVGTENTIFYHGIKVGTWDKYAHLTYNYVSPLDLTEDRTVDSLFTVKARLENAFRDIRENANEKLWQRMLVNKHDSVEDGIPIYANAYEALLSFIERHGSTPGFSPKARGWYARHRAKEAPGVVLTLDEYQQKLWSDAVALLANTPYALDDTIKVNFVKELGDAYGMASMMDKTIAISLSAFAEGVSCLAATLLEEIIHVRFHIRDGRPMQERLLKLCVELLERSEKTAPQDDDIPY